MAVVATVALSCAPLGGSFETQCTVQDDQKDTLVGRWQEAPIPITVASGVWSAGEITSIRRAIDSWNSFSQSVHKFQFMDPGNGSSIASSSSGKPGSLCSSSIVGSSGFTGSVNIFKNTTWPFANSENVVALTSFCRINDSPFARIYTAIMDVNFEFFFRAGLKNPDLESTMLHEFGHLLGLGHSCESSPTLAGIPNCSAAGLPAEYISAVMFPAVKFSGNNAVPRRALQRNDQGRANCLYGDI